jgi:peptide/nickel transport system ATP-binding protein
MVARALLMRPKLIVADEPVSMVDASLRATILGSLRKLNEEKGISIIYITHDLATAYQVSDSILVMYRAAVVESGDVERVVRHPQHPYTQKLIASIPQVDTERGWLGGGEESGLGVNVGGCRFAPRCPFAEAACARAVPPLLRTETARAVACIRHAGPPLEDLAGVLAPAAMA